MKDSGFDYYNVRSNRPTQPFVIYSNSFPQKVFKFLSPNSKGLHFVLGEWGVHVHNWRPLHIYMICAVTQHDVNGIDQEKS